MYLSWVLDGRILYALAQSKAVEITMMILVTLCLSGEYRINALTSCPLSYFAVFPFRPSSPITPHPMTHVQV